MNRHSITSLYLLALVLATTVAWAYRTPIDVAVQAGGIVRPRSGAVRVVSEAGGKILRVQAREGMTVRQGDPLVELDPRELLLKQRMLQTRIHAAEIASAHTRLLNLYAQLEQSQLDVGRLTIASPCNGTISSMMALHAGEILTQGAAIASIISHEEDLVIESWLPTGDRRWVKEGQKARMVDESETFDGVVLSISPDARVTDSLAVYRVLLAPEPYGPPLRAGMTFQVHFITKQERLLWLLFRRIHGALS